MQDSGFRAASGEKFWHRAVEHVEPREHLGHKVEKLELTQRAQDPLIKEYGLNYIGLHVMV